VFVILGDILKLFIAYGAVKWPENFRYLGLESGATSDVPFSGLALFLCFVALALRIQFASLGYCSFDHPKVLTSFSQPSCIIFDVEWDWVNPSILRQSERLPFYPTKL
jgi:hypothetical protein